MKIYTLIFKIPIRSACEADFSIVGVMVLPKMSLLNVC